MSAGSVGRSTKFTARNEHNKKKRAKEGWAQLKSVVKGEEDEPNMPFYAAPREKESSKKQKVLSHGMQYARSLSLGVSVVDVIHNEISDELVVLDESHTISVYRLSDGQYLFNVLLEDPICKVVFMGNQLRYVGLIKHNDRHPQTESPQHEELWSSTLVLYSQNFEVLSKYFDNLSITNMLYNPYRRHLVTIGMSNITAWCLHYEDTHLVPEVSSEGDVMRNVELSMITYEHNANPLQKLYAIAGTSCYVFKADNLQLKETKRSLHVANISSVMFFNPAKCLLTGSVDGSIKMWDQNWSVKLVFIGHNNPVSSLSVYPDGPFVISSSSDNSIRVWSLETSDEASIIDVHSHPKCIISKYGSNTIASVHDNEICVYTVEDLYSLFTSIGDSVNKIQRSSKYFAFRRLACSCDDSTVRIVCPNTGNVLTTILLDYEDRVKDAVCVSRINCTFVLLESNEIIRANMTTNPATITNRWKFDGPKISCFCIYEHVGGKELLGYEESHSGPGGKDIWKGLARAVETSELQQSVEKSNDRKKEHENPVLLFLGKNDGNVGLVDIETGEVTFEMIVHEMSNITSLVANPEFDQLITAATDKVVKLWKVSPFATMEPLTAPFPFFLPATPTNICCLRNKIFVAYQDSILGCYASSVLTQERNRFDHPPSDDHTDRVVSACANPKMKIFASAGEDECIRIWSDHSRLIRVLRINAPIFSIEFSSDCGDLVVGIGDHLYRINHVTYFTKSLLYKALTVGLDDFKIETPVHYDESKLQSLDMADVKRLKAAHCSNMNFTDFEDKLPKDEQQQLDQELQDEKTKYLQLIQRDSELEMLRNGQYDALKKSKHVYNEKIKQIAFKNYISKFFQSSNVNLPKIEETFTKNNKKVDEKAAQLNQKDIKLPSSNKSTDKKGEAPEIEEGFFPTLKSKNLKFISPMINLSGPLPNSVALKSLYPDDVLKEHEKQFKPREFTAEELAEMEYYNKLRMKEGENSELITFMDEDDDGIGIVAELNEKQEGKSSLLEKLQKAARTPSPSPEPEKTEAELEAEQREARVKELEEMAANKQSKESELVAEKKSKPVRKYVSRPKQKSPKPITPVTPGDGGRDSSAADRNKIASEDDTPRPETPLPAYITKNKGQDWYDKFFPDLNERTFPKPWYPKVFAEMVLRYIKTCDIQYKSAMVDYLKELHEEWDLSDMRDVILESLLFVLNKSDAPNGDTVYGRAYFQACLRLFPALGCSSDFDIIVEAMCIYLEKDAVTKKVAIDALRKMGVQDPQRYFYKAMDAWELPMTNDPNYKREVLEMSSMWLREWMRKLSEQVEYVIDELKSGTMILPGPDGKKFAKQKRLTSSDVPEPTRAVTAVLQRLPEDVLDFVTPIEAINYYTETELSNFFDRSDNDRRELLDTSNRRTVLVLPKVPVERSLARIGELHTSKCRPKRESNYADASQLSKPPRVDVWSKFTTHINLPMKRVPMNPFGDDLDELMYQLEQQQPVLLMLKTNQKYFVPENSVAPPL